MTTVLVPVLEIFNFVTLATFLILSGPLISQLQKRHSWVANSEFPFLLCAMILVDDTQVPGLTSDQGAWPRGRNLGRRSVSGVKSDKNTDAPKGFCGQFLDLMMNGRLDRTKVF